MPQDSVEQQGYQVFTGAATERRCDGLIETLSSRPDGQTGMRDLLETAACANMARKLRTHESLRAVIPARFVAVQCTLFSKSPDRNWLVAPHQDLSIPVRAKVASPSCTGWASKAGALFVQPPVAVLERLVAVRLQLDPHAASTGPLRIAPASHRDGRLASDGNLRHGREFKTCVVERGGVVAMRPLLVHASSKAVSPHPRRVLHFLFGPPRLPLGLEWAKAI